MLCSQFRDARNFNSLFYSSKLKGQGSDPLQYSVHIPSHVVPEIKIEEKYSTKMQYTCSSIPGYVIQKNVDNGTKLVIKYCLHRLAMMTTKKELRSSFLVL